MARATLSIVAAAWLFAATQVAAGPISAAGDSEAATSELDSLGGLLQALGAGVIGNGALLYPTAASSHQREESEILASDTATRVYKKVRSILKEGGINEEENGEDESKSVTYLAKPAMIFHKEELPPLNPLAAAAQTPAMHVSNIGRMYKEEQMDDNDNDEDMGLDSDNDDDGENSDLLASDEEPVSDALAESDADNAAEIETTEVVEASPETLSVTSVEKKGADSTGSEAPAHNTSSRSLSIETVGAVEATLAKETEATPATQTAESSTSDVAKMPPKSTSADSDNESGDDSDSDSDSDDASEKDGDSESDDEDEDGKKAEKDEDDDDKGSDARAKAKARYAVTDENGMMGAIQRMAALGLSEAQKAIEELDENSDATDGLDVLTADDASTSAILSAASITAPAVGAVERVAETAGGDIANPSSSRANRVNADDDSDDDSDSDSDDASANDEDADSDSDDASANDEDSDSDSDDASAAKDLGSDSDEDEDDASANDEDTDSDSDDASAAKDLGSDSDESDNESEAPRVAKSTSDNSSSPATSKQTMAVDAADEDQAAREALSEAAAESFQQAIDAEATQLESEVSAEESELGSGVARDTAVSIDEKASEGASKETDTASDDLDKEASDDLGSDGASDDNFEFETEAGVNSDGEEDEDLLSEGAPNRADADADEDEDEDDDEEEGGLHVQRDAAADDGSEEQVRSVEASPDVDAIKASQNRAMNIGLGNLRRHV